MTIFHLIDNLKRGGAETLLHQVVTNLKEHKNFIITLTTENEFTALEMKDIKVINLGFTKLLSLPFIILRLKKIVSLHRPDIVHAHLPLSSLIARISTPSNIKLFISVHNKYSESLKKISPRLFFFERKLHSKRDKLLFVSDSIRKDYDQIIGIKGTFHVLHNFISEKYFARENQLIKNSDKKKNLKLVSIGSLKKQKNFETLIKAFSMLDTSKFTLDVLGEGPERVNLEKLIKQLQLNNINLRGLVPNVESYLKNYDAYIIASNYEGFGIAPLEAAAVGLPLLVSDIDVFIEVTKGYATYFSPHDEKEIARKINVLMEEYESAYQQAKAFKSIVYKNYSKEIYLNQLQKYYKS